MDFTQVLLNEEFKFKGILPGLLITTTHGAFQFMAYEELKRIILLQKGDGNLVRLNLETAS